MNTRILVLFLLLAALWAHPSAARGAPNVIVIFVDDLGWPDAGPGWSSHLGSLGLGVPPTTDLRTPNIDSLAAHGVCFTNGYVSCPVCSPSRAGLMTGRHQQRFGYEMNPGPDLEYDPVFGLPLTECTLGDRMKALGYATSWIGKSHLGALPDYHPVRRGFDRFFGFLEGHHDYCAFEPCSYPANTPPPWQLTPAQRAQLDREDWDPIQRATAPLGPANQPVIVETSTYLTTAFGNEIVDTIDRHRRDHPSDPFCIYAPFNAVHEPVEVTQEFIDRTLDLFPPYPVPPTPTTALRRHRLAAMLLAIDDAIGAVLTKLRSYDLGNGRTLENETLIFFSSDNGAPPPDRNDRNGSVSLPLRGNKSALYEGGIRVPYIVQWLDELSPRDVAVPVSTMDILPTCVEAAGGTVPAAWQLDGVSLLPYLRGQAPEPHPTLFWRVETGRADEMEPGPRAIRQGKWKLIKPEWRANWELYDLSTANGLRETENLADSRPDILRELLPLYDSWAAILPRPRWDYNDPDYVTPTFVLEDIRVGPASQSCFGPEFLPGTDQLAWQDETGRLWRGSVDLLTGFPAGAALEVTTGLAPVSVENEGPQWGISASGAALFYTKAGAGGRLQIWRGTGPLTAATGADSTGPRVSQEPGAPAAGMIFTRGTTTVAASETAPAAVVALPNQAAVPRNGRWIPGTGELIYVRTGSPVQLARWNPVTGTSVTLTDDGGLKTDACAFHAPEYGGELCYACVVDHEGIAVYRDLHRGGGLFDRVATLTVPSTEAARFLYRMKPLQGGSGFNGVSWFSCVAWQNNPPASPGASAVWLLGLGIDPVHRLPRPLPPPNPDGSQSRNDLCDEWKPLALRVSDPLATGIAEEPETVIGTREVFCYYSRVMSSGQVQLRRARTGLVRPDATAPTGFASLEHTSAFTAGEPDVAGLSTGGTETTALATHDGQLFAALSSDGDEFTRAQWTGVQFLVRDAAGGPWRIDHSGDLTTMFRQHRAVDVLTELTFTREGPSPMEAPVKRLVAGLRDIGLAGSHLASARIRLGPGQWAHSEIATTVEPAHALCYAVHFDADINNDGLDDGAGLNGLPLGVERIYAGLSNGEIYRGTFARNPDRLIWNPAADLAFTTVKLGPVTSMAVANGRLFAACGLRQDVPTDPVTGGLYVRNDHADSWDLLAPWPSPLPVSGGTEHDLAAGSLTTVPDPRGCDHEVLLLTRSWPGVVELVDPGRGYAVTTELDVRDFFARLWNDSSVRSQEVTVGYTPCVPAVDPVTGRGVHLLGVRITRPSSPASTHFLVRHADGTWEAAEIPGVTPGGTRCFAVSPFPADRGAAFYFGGGDVGAGPAADTAWIVRGTWNAWPALALSLPGTQTVELSWPATSEEWILESSDSLTNWLPVAEKPALSLTGSTLSLGLSSRSFFRLSKP